MLIGILVVLLLLFVLYTAFLQKQLRSMNHQLDKRLAEQSRQPIHLELISKELNRLAISINKCLKVEEALRLKSIQEEKNFKKLIANISHDLRTPLTAIKGYQQLLQKSPLSNEQQKKLQIAQKHTIELGELIEHFFEYSYLLHTEPELQVERINLTNLVTECLAAAVPALEERGLTVTLAETLPIFIFADKNMLFRIIQNLVNNAIQHSSGNIEVRLQAVDKATISFINPVKTTAALNAELLFERFYTGDKSRSRSTGLGLAIVKLLTERMGGNTYAVLRESILEIQIVLPN